MVLISLLLTSKLRNFHFANNVFLQFLYACYSGYMALEYTSRRTFLVKSDAESSDMLLLLEIISGN